MAISMGELKKGLKIELEGVPYKIVEYQHVKPGKGAAFVRTKIKSFLDGRVIEKTFHAGDKCEKPELESKKMQYLYADGDNLQFMDTVTYEQLGLSKDQVGETVNWITESMEIEVLFHNQKPIAIDPPAVVNLKVVETPPNFKGDTSSGSKKPATLETGAVIQVPYHVLEGDVVRVDTATATYLEKLK
ncbi:MAG: elongation factor P [Helicobacteraceae bacterium]